MKVLTADVEMSPPDRVLYFNQTNNYTGMFPIMFNSIISVNTSPHEFLSAALKCYNTFNWAWLINFIWAGDRLVGGITKFIIKWETKGSLQKKVKF